MSGLFGLFTTPPAAPVAPTLEAMTGSLRHFPWQQDDRWLSADGTAGLGRSHLNIMNREPQPFISPDGRFVVALTGEFYRDTALRAQLGIGQQQPPTELALAAYQHFGETFARHLDGDFFIAVYDTQARRLLLTCDRLGQYPHYLWQERGRLAFAPEVKAVLCAPFARRQLDLTALAEYTRFQHLLETRTFHQGVERFPYGSVGVFDLNDGSWRVERYWDWDQIAFQPNITREEAVREGGRRLREAVEVRTQDTLRPGVFLSGGLDGRSIVGMMPPGKPLVTATFGQARARDVIYAAMIARAAGSRHHWFDLPDGRWIVQHVEQQLTVTEGFHSWVHMHGITMLPTLRGLIDYNLSGWDGGTVMFSSDPNDPTYHAPDIPALEQAIYEGMTGLNQAATWTWPGLTDVEAAQVFSTAIAKQVNGLARQSLHQAVQRYEAFHPQWRGEYFFIINSNFRLLQNMVTLARSHIEVRAPFWDYRLVEFVYRLPLHLRVGLYREIITREMPRLARIPMDKTDYLATTELWLYEAHRFTVRARRKLGLFPARVSLYADYENYLRHELRPWAESILFDERTADRGIFNPDFVRTLLERHAAGHEPLLLGKIAPLITLEMVLRRYFDE